MILESTKAAADIYAPVSGEIVAVNDAVRAAPDLLNQSPEDIGWLFKIRLSNPEELGALMNRTTYQQLVDSSTTHGPSIKGPWTCESKPEVDQPKSRGKT